MPVYEFVCAQCQRKFRKLVGMTAHATPPQCPRCQSTELSRQISRFARVRSEDESFDALADDMEGLDENDPKAMRRLVREMGQEMGEDLESDFEQIMEEEESGTPDPSDIPEE
jgi:putative FmdB family regulatory protein